LAAELQKFSHLSVRENSGKEILKNIGIPEVEIMPDPALLFEEKKLHDIISTEKEKKNEVFFYILQNKQHNIQQLLSYCKQQLKLNTKKANTRSLLSIEQWLCCFRDTKLVVTNSFHGIVFSILFQKPFVAIPIEGKFAGMNDRIYTLLEKFELTDRILEQLDKQKFIDIKNTPIETTCFSFLKKSPRETKHLQHSDLEFQSAYKKNTKQSRKTI
jgi:polysaccharide pyruvyl transferase WcaK-like protein